MAIVPVASVPAMHSQSMATSRHVSRHWLAAGTRHHVRMTGAPGESDVMDETLPSGILWRNDVIAEGKDHRGLACWYPDPSVISAATVGRTFLHHKWMVAHVHEKREGTVKKKWAAGNGAIVGGSGLLVMLNFR